MKYKNLFVLIPLVLILLTTNLIAFAGIETEFSSENTYCENPEEYPIKQENENLKQNLGLSLLAEFVGAFLGVLTALGLNKYAEIKNISKLQTELYMELSKISDELEARLKEKEDYIFYQYSTPLWDINLAAGNLSLFISSKKYKPYIEIYARIQYAQSLENEYSSIRTLKNNMLEDSFKIYKTTIENARKREAKEIYDMIINLKRT